MISTRESFTRVWSITAVYAMLIVIAVLTLFPLIWMFSSSFRSDVEIFEYNNPVSYKTFVPDRLILQSYRNLFTLRDFQIPLRNTLIVSLSCILIGCGVNGIAGFAFAKFDFKLKRVLFALIMLSFMIPFESLAIPLYRLVSGLGWIDTFQGIVVPTIADGLAIFLFKQFFEEIPNGIIDSARIDGASTITVLLKIVVPLSVPAVITAGLVIFVTNWSAFVWPLIIAHSPPHRLIQVALTDFKLEHATLWSELFAASTISTLIPILLFLPFQRYYVAGVTSSGLKG